MLQGSVFLFPFGVEEVKPTLLRRVWVFGRFKALNEYKLGYLVGGE